MENTKRSSGDTGQTDLPNGIRISKTDVLIETLGALDELAAALGLLRAALPPSSPESARIETIQRTLLVVCAEVATGQSHLDPSAIPALERETALLESVQTPPRDFVFPGVNEPSARAHWARTVCRRAERQLVRARDTHAERIASPSIAYLNRLSRHLFAVAHALESPPA